MKFKTSSYCTCPERLHNKINIKITMPCFLEIKYKVIDNLEAGAALVEVSGSFNSNQNKVHELIRRFVQTG